MTRESRLEEAAAVLAYSFDGEIRIGGNYVPLLRDGSTFHVTGQIPGVGDEVVVTGPAGAHSRTSVGAFQLPKNATVEHSLPATVE